MLCRSVEKRGEIKKKGKRIWDYRRARRVTADKSVIDVF